MKKIIVCIIVMIILTTAGWSQPVQPECPPGFVCTDMVPERVPLGSLGSLEAYGLTLVAQISGGVYGDSVSGKSSFLVPYGYRDANPVRMAEVASAQVLHVAVDPDESLLSYLDYLWVDPESGNSYQIFFGQTFFRLQNDKGGWSLPPEALKVRMELNDYIPLRIPGLAGAYMRIERSGDEPETYYDFAPEGRIDTENGLIFIGQKHLGHEGELYVRLSDGRKVVYDLKTEKRKPLETVAGRFAPTIRGVRVVPSNTSDITIQTDDSLIQATYDESQIVVVTVQTDVPHPQYPTGVKVVDADLFTSDPEIEAEYFDLVSGKATFVVNSGQRIFIRVERPASPLGFPPGYGKGSTSELQK